MNSEIDLDLESIINLILLASEKAAIEILNIYYNDKNYLIKKKKDNSPVTEADLLASHVLCRELNKILPIPVISEEDIENIDLDLNNINRYWLIDPLDGTKSFIKQEDEFTINIALINNGVPILGLVTVPVTGVSYFSSIGNGAYIQDKLGFIQKISTKKICDSLNIITSRSTNVKQLEKSIQSIPLFITQKSSSIKMCEIAEGTYDFYPRLFGTSTWDTAAAHAILHIASHS